MMSCQQPKPVLLAVGLNQPAWVPHNMPIQIFKIGNLVIAGVPGEFTTMSGRRIKKLLQETFQEKIQHVVIAGLSNSYAGYVTTPEEYMQQNYEGGFTAFGRWTLAAYLLMYFRASIASCIRVITSTVGIKKSMLMKECQKHSTLVKLL